MMKNPENIQQILNNKAREKLETDIHDFLTMVTDSPLWDSISSELNIEANPDKNIPRDSLRSFFWKDHHTRTSEPEAAAKLIMKNLLPKYIEAESKAFFEKVNNLQSQLQDFEQNYQGPE